jgi:hypothetical protein
MHTLPLNSTSPLPGPVGFFFTKLHFGFLSMVVHGFFYMPPMESLDNSNGLLISRPTQNIYNLERPSEHIYNLKKFRASMHVQCVRVNVGSHLSIPQSAASAVEGQDVQEQID